MRGEEVRKNKRVYLYLDYLRYIFQRNGGQEAQVKDRVKRATAIMGHVWDKEKKIQERLGEKNMAV